MERRPPHHLVFGLATVLLGVVLAGVAGPTGASYPSSEPGDDDAAPAPRRSATAPPRSPARAPLPCDAFRLGDEIAERCLRDFGAVPPPAPCCAALLAAGRGGPFADTGLECFCAALMTDDFQMVAIGTLDAVDMYYQCGGRHNVTVCMD